MDGIAQSLLFALGNLAQPRILWLMVWPALVAVGLWGTVVFIFWTQFVLWLAEHLGEWITQATFFMSWDSTAVALFAAKVLIFVMLVPLIQLTALLILGVFGMQAMVEHVASRRFVELARQRGGTFAGSVWNSVVALLGLVVLFAVSVPLWLFPPLWPILPVLILGWVNQRVLRYDALAEHADAQEMPALFRAQRANLYLLGVILALVAYIPVIGLFAPVLFGLAFIHYLLGALQKRRAAS
ncbi:MAG: EI24 domain-containing protein [Proteobacteria bacterium]|nr:EI24 domain-containing protein [Pseudomonadota bacterium]